MARKDPRTLLFAEHASIAQAIEVADRVCSRRLPLLGAVYAPEIGETALSKRITTGRRAERGFKLAGANPQVLSLPGRKPGVRTARALVWQDPATDFIFVVSVRDEFDIVHREIRRYLLTDLTPVYVNTAMLRKCLDVSSAADSGTLVLDYTAWVMGPTSPQAETRRVWLPEPKEPAAFFESIEEDDQRIRSVGLRLGSAQGRIRRDLTFVVTLGWAAFLERVLVPLTQLSKSARAVYVDRGADRSPTHTPRPLSIRYQARVFEDKANNHRLIAVLRSLPDAAVSVFHPNPYLHASVMDYADGSSYMIWVNDHQSIIVIPEARASTGSLERLCNHITERFGEGLIGEANS